MIIKSHNQSISSEKMQRCQDYIQALEKERCKIQVFQRELPLCLELVTQAIETCKQQLSGTTSHEYNSNGGQYECSEETSSDMPVLEEFMPIKRASSHSDDDEKQKLKKTKNDTNKDCKVNEKNSKKSDWLRSVQLWNNQTSDPPSNYKQNSPRKVAVMEVKKSGNGGAFHPFKKIDKNVETIPTPERTVPPASASSTAETGGSSGTAGNKVEKDGQSHSQRKSRRCWSPELHRRFLQALQQLGGSHAATPKQIRELMKVDGLTNDEVKSHLQKYRLHTRRPSPAIHTTTTTTTNNTQTPQFLVVGGIWVPPEYATMAAPGTTITSREPSTLPQGNGIYAPIATLPLPMERASNQSQQNNNSSNSDNRGSHSEGHVQSHSPATSSSSRHN